MKTIRKKLRSDRGSSMVLALFLMLVALMVSHTILAAAVDYNINSLAVICTKPVARD